MSVDGTLVFIFGLILLDLGIVKFLDFIEKNAKSTWWTIAEGKYVDSLSHFTDSKTSTKMTGYYAKLPPIIWTTIVFEDASRIKIINVDSLPEPGTKIRVLKNGRADFQIEKV